MQVSRRAPGPSWYAQPLRVHQTHQAPMSISAATDLMSEKSRETCYDRVQGRVLRFHLTTETGNYVHCGEKSIFVDFITIHLDESQDTSQSTSLKDRTWKWKQKFKKMLGKKLNNINISIRNQYKARNQF